jgi:hypothetical protein
VEVIKKNTRFQYELSGAERSDVYLVDQERFKSRIAAITLAEMTITLAEKTWLYSRA